LPQAPAHLAACLVQMATPPRLLALQLVLRLLCQDRGPVCLLDLARLPAQPRQPTLDSPRLLVTGHRARVLQLLCQDRGPVYLVDQAKPAPLLRREPLDPRQLLAADFRLREQQRQLAAERSSGFQS
jgi:hypothetical protein